jgi:hypothetical protein
LRLQFGQPCFYGTACSSLLFGAHLRGMARSSLFLGAHLRGMARSSLFLGARFGILGARFGDYTRLL